MLSFSSKTLAIGRTCTHKHFSKLSNVAVIGAGLMGAGIAQVSAQAGYKVSIVDQNNVMLSNARSTIENSLKVLVKKRFKDDKAAAEKFITGALSRLQFCVGVSKSASDLSTADLIIEAIPEKLELKQSLFVELDTIAQTECMFISNTSSLPISDIFDPVTDRKDRCGGLHFFCPVPLMKLVEVVALPETTTTTRDELTEFCKNIGKIPVHCKDTPGFIVNRLLIPYAMQALQMYERGDATIEDIDTAMKLGAGYAIGPFELLDFVGLDIWKGITDGWASRFKDDPVLSATSPIVDKLVAENKLGRKTGDSTATFEEYATNGQSLETSERTTPLFCVNEKWNKCITLCSSNGIDVTTDAFVRATDETLTDTMQHPENLLDLCGDELKEELGGIGDCPTGDARVTRAFNLKSAKHIIHAVPPIYSHLFHTASLSALHSVYKSILNSIIELEVRTLSLPPMFIVPGQFPPESACHMILRTFRRYFDYFGPEPFVDSIILCCPDETTSELYRKVLPFYFPRNSEEEKLSLLCDIPADDGFGAPVMKERTIPIKILVPKASNDGDGECQLSSAGVASMLGQPTSPPEDTSRIMRIRRAFTFGSGRGYLELMKSNRHSSITNKTSSPPLPNPADKQAAKPVSPVVDRALKADLSALVASGFLSVVGSDRDGRHVVLMIAKNLDMSKFDLSNEILLYFIRILDPIVSRSSKDFVFIYCHTQCGDRSMSAAQAGCLAKAVCDTDERFVSRLKCLYILHLDWRSKVNVTYARLTTLPRQIADKIVVLNCCQQLVETVLPLTPSAGKTTSNGIDALLPQFILDYDSKNHQNHNQGVI